MRIDSNAIIHKVSSLRPKNIAAVEGPAPPETDSIELSGRAADFRAAMEALSAAPAVREARVAELRQQLEQGSLVTDGESLAAKLLKRG